MDVVHTIREAREKINKARGQGKKIGFVPTMGYLHDGHLGLVEISKKNTDYQVMSIFVNRIQFNDKKDFDLYPKDLERDFKLAESAGVDLIFNPDENEMYNNNLTHVDIALLTDNLCGAHRPGHFKGVFTVVSKLFNIVQPDVSVFGQKDIQQAVSIEKMISDLNFPIKIIIAPTRRENDGLAMSSRNARLNPDERKKGLAIYNSLVEARRLMLSGERNVDTIITSMNKIISESNPQKIDYISVVRYSDLSLIKKIEEKSVIAVAVFYGSTRLIDNMVIEIEGDSVKCIF